MLLYFLIMVLFGCSLPRATHAERADLILFSKDRPLQLKGLLASIEYYITGLQSVVVLCHAKNEKFTQAYQRLAQAFPTVTFVYQNQKDPQSDFWPLLQNIFAHMSAPYIMLGPDDTIVTDHIDLSACIDAIKANNAYAFYPYMGTEITHCYMTHSHIPPPPLSKVKGNLYKWNLLTGKGPWGYIHSVYMAIYPRSHLDYIMRTIRATSPNQFEMAWGGAAKLPPVVVGLCYKNAHIMNIPINLVQRDCPDNPCSRRYTVEQLLDLFESGWCIDFKRLYKFPHNAPHTDIDLPLIKR